MTEFERIDDKALRVSAPAKVNLMLSVHGRREDGFHELTSVVAPLEFGDELEVRISDRKSDTLSSDGDDVPLDDSNLVLQAARLFREASGCDAFFDFNLSKRIPVGAGLGGGSSDGVAALKAMDTLMQTDLGNDRLREISAKMGSDCPLFVEAAPAVMRGRGEVIEPLPKEVAGRLSGQKLVLFRPFFAVNTGWAYGQLASRPERYENQVSALSRIDAYLCGGDTGELLLNTFEGVVGDKFVAIPTLLEELRQLGYHTLMSGSGSSCFALVNDDNDTKKIKDVCCYCWGEGIFWVETSIA